MTHPFVEQFEKLPLIATIDNPIEGRELEMGETMVQAGISIIQFPIQNNRASPLIRQYREYFGDRVVVGCSNVYAYRHYSDAKNADAQFMVTPNVPEKPYWRERYTQDMVCVVGAATLTEAFRAQEMRAGYIMAYPSASIPPEALVEWRKALPAQTKLLVGGGINGRKETIDYHLAGAKGYMVHRPNYSAYSQSDLIGYAVVDWATSMVSFVRAALKTPREEHICG